MERAMKAMLEAMAVRQQLQQQTNQRNAPIAITRQPDRPVPNLSPRGTQLLQAILGARGGDTAVTPQPGGQLIDKGNPSGSPMLASRADLLAQQVPPAQETPVPGDPRTFTPEQSLDLFLNSPAGQYAGGRYNDPSQRESVVQRFILDGLERKKIADAAAQQEQELAQQVQATAPGGRQTLPTGTGVPYPTLVSGIGQPGTESYKQDQIAQIDAYIAARDYSDPPPGSDIDDATWDGYDTAQRIAVAEGIRNQYESMPATVPEQLEDIQLEAGADNDFETRDGGNPLAPVGEAVLGAIPDVVKSRGKQLGEWALDFAEAGINKRHETEGELMYYMATHDGDLPFWAGPIYGKSFLSGVEDSINNAALAGHEAIFGKDEPDQPSLEDVQRMQSSGQGPLSKTDKTNNPMGPNWLANNPQFAPTVAKIYEDAEAARKAAETDNDPNTNPDDLPTGAEAVQTWFQSNQTTLARITDELVLDPYNVLLALKVPASVAKAAAAAHEIDGMVGVARVLNGAGIVLDLASDPLSRPVERLFEGLGWGLRRIPGAGWTDNAVKEETEASLRDSAELISRGDAEADFMAEKNARAEAQATKQAAEEKRIRDDGAADQRARDAQARNRLRKEEEAARKKYNDDLADQRAAEAKYRDKVRRQEEAKRAQYEADQAAAEQQAANEAERAARVELDAEIKAANKRVDDARKLAEDKANYRRMWEERRNRAMAKQQTVQEKAEASAAVKRAKEEEKAAIQAEKEAQAELDRLIAAANARAMPETMPLEASPVNVPENVEVTPAVGGEPVGDQLPMRETPSQQAITESNAEINAPSATTPADEAWDLGYLDPDYVSKRYPNEPNLAKLARDVYGPEDPEALARFRQQYSDLARRWMKHDENLRSIEARAGARGASQQTPQRIVDKLNFETEADALFEMNFGTRPEFKRYLVFGDELDPNNPMSVIEHAVHATDPGASQYATDLIRNWDRQIHPNFTNDQLATWAEGKNVLKTKRTTRPNAPAVATPTPKSSATTANGERAEKAARNKVTTSDKSGDEVLESGVTVHPRTGEESNQRLVRSADGKYRIQIQKEDGSWARQNTFKLESSARKHWNERIVPEMKDAPATATADAGTPKGEVIPKGDAHFDTPNRDRSTYQAIPTEDDRMWADSYLQDLDEEVSSGGQFSPGDRKFKRDPNIPNQDDDITYLLEHAVFGSEDTFGVGASGKIIKSNKIQGSATRAREILRNKFGLGPQADYAKRLRKQAFGAQIDEFPTPKSGQGFSFNPRDEARRLSEHIQSAKEGIGSRIDEFGRKKVPGDYSAPRDGEIPTIPTHVVNSDELGKVIARRPQITQRQVDDLTREYTITVGKGEAAREVKTSYWDQYIKRRNELTSKTLAPYKGEIPDSESEKLVDALVNDYELARDMAFDDLKIVYTPAQRGKIKKTMAGMSNGTRSALMFNVVTGPRAIVNDWLTTDWRVFLNGQGGAVKGKAKFVKALTKSTDYDDIAMLPMMDRVRRSGAVLPHNVILTAGREEVSRETRGGIWGKLNPLSNDFVKTLRGAQDNAARLSVIVNYFEKNHIFKRRDFMRAVREKADKLSDQGLYDDILGLGNDFNADDVRRITRAHGMTDDSLARLWAKQVDDLMQEANAAQRKILFSYKKTKIDNALGKVFLFHYYMTRSSVQYLKLMMQHPQLIRMEAELWEASKESLEDLPAPDWMKGYIGWMTGNGHAVYTNPAYAISGLGLWSSIGDTGYSKTKVEEALNMTGLFPHPMVQAALAITGHMNMTDPTGTGQLQKMGFAIWNEIKNSDYGREHGWQGVQGNFIRDAINSMADHANEFAREWLNLPISDINFADDEALKMSDVRKTMAANFIEEFGEPDTWDDTTWDLFEDALQDMIDDVPNDYVDAALDEWSELNRNQVVGNAVVPTGVVTQDVDAANVQNRIDEAYDSTGRTSEDQAYMDMGNISSTRSRESLALASDSRRYYELVDGQNQIIKDGVRQLVDGNIPEGMVGTIGGVKYTAADINAMSESERFDLAEQWISDQGALQSKNSIGMTSPSGRLAETTKAQDALRAGSPELDDFLDYQSYAYKKEDEPGGLRRWRNELLAETGDTEFKRAHDRKRTSLAGEGLAGEELELELDQWMKTQQAFASLMGWQWRSNLDPGSAIFNVTDPAPWREAAMDQTTSTNYGGSTKDKPKKDVGLHYLGQRGRQTAKFGYNVTDNIYALPGSKNSGNSGQSGGIFDEWLRAP